MIAVGGHTERRKADWPTPRLGTRAYNLDDALAFCFLPSDFSVNYTDPTPSCFCCWWLFLFCIP